MPLQYPGAVQTSYSIYTNALQAGMLLFGDADLPSTILSYVSATQNIGFGIGVVGDFVNGDKNIKLPSSSGDKCLGVTILNAAMESPVFDTTGTGINPNYYVPTYPIPVLSANNGAAVNIDGNVAPGGAVYLRFAGRRQVQTIVFSATLITANVIAGTVTSPDGTVTPISVTFATSNAATLTAIAAAIAAAPGVLSAVSNGTDTITVTTTVDGALVGLTSFAVTLGASQATVTITQTVVGVSDANIGFFRGDSDTGTALAVSGARWLSTVAASQAVPSLGQLVVNIPVGSGF